MVSELRTSQAASVVSLLCLWLFISPVLASPFDCAHAHCGLITRGTNPDLVVGTVEAAATSAELAAVFRWAHAHGYWQTLPAHRHGYVQFMQLLSLAVATPAGPRSVSVLMSREEYDAGPFERGALVRYSPHDAAHDAITYGDPARQAYWALVGCVAQLCAVGDGACIARYRQGLFNRRTGVQLEMDTRRAMRGGATIDPHTLLPVRQSSKP